MSMKILIPAHDGSLEHLPSPPPNLTPSPDKTPEQIAQHIADRDAKIRCARSAFSRAQWMQVLDLCLTTPLPRL